MSWFKKNTIVIKNYDFTDVIGKVTMKNDKLINIEFKPGIGLIPDAAEAEIIVSEDKTILAISLNW